MKIRKRLQFLCYLSSLLLILSSCSSGDGGSSENATVGSGDSGEDDVSSSCIYESIPASNVIFSSDSKMSFYTAKSAGFTKGISVFGVNFFIEKGREINLNLWGGIRNQFPARIYSPVRNKRKKGKNCSKTRPVSNL